MPIKLIRRFDPVDGKPIPNSTPQCTAKPVETRHLVESKWREKRYKPRGTIPEQCQRNAVVTINGKPYCKAHAGAISVRMWLDGELEETSTDEPK